MLEIIHVKRTGQVTHKVHFIHVEFISVQQINRSPDTKNLVDNFLSTIFWRPIFGQTDSEVTVFVIFEDKRRIEQNLKDTQFLSGISL